MDFENIASLDSNGTTTLLCECDANEYSWVYLPSRQIKPHRIIMTGNFSRNNNNPELIKRNRISCTVEYSGKISKEMFFNELKKLPFQMKPISYNYCKNSYILHDQESLDKINNFKCILKSEQIYCCGRFAEWQYYNMDAAIESAFNIVDQIKSNYNTYHLKT